jgi:predicted aspartyl protease
MQKGQSFTVQANGLLPVLRTDVWIASAFDPATTHYPPPLKKYQAIWDTGATGTVITEQVIRECGLKPISMVKAVGVDGEYNTEVYLINIRLPNGVGFASARVTRGKLRGMDVLIGMDVICHGDFAVTNFDNKTCFSFRCPSLQRIDFTGMAPKPAGSVPKAGRNDPCPCGSGKKFKHCCGK